MAKLTEVQERWLADLRSGEFDQCTGVLYDGYGGYCCLGVGCVSAGAKFIQKDEDEESEDYLIPSLNGEFLNEYDLLNALARELLGITSEQQEKYAAMNDGSSYVGSLPIRSRKWRLGESDATKWFDKHTFAEIADEIEADLLEFPSEE